MLFENLLTYFPRRKQNGPGIFTRPVRPTTMTPGTREMEPVHHARHRWEPSHCFAGCENTRCCGPRG